MIKAIVVAHNYNQFATYLRNRGFKREEYGYFIWNHPEKVYGLDTEKTKVLWLEGWSEGALQYNPVIVSEGIDFLKQRFSNHQNVSEVWIYGKGSFI